MITELTVKAFWDDESLVWVAASGDVPGLIVDAYTLEKLFTKLATLAPELLELNGVQEPHLKGMNEHENDSQRRRAMTADREAMLGTLVEALANYVHSIFGAHGCAKEYAGQFRVAAEYALAALEPLIAGREEAAQRGQREAIMEIIHKRKERLVKAEDRNEADLAAAVECWEIITAIRARGEP